MSRHRLVLRALFATMAVVALPCQLLAEVGPALLGSEGELYRVLSGPYNQLFDDSGSNQNQHVLALEITRPDQTSERILVPGTNGAEVETAPSLSLERSSDTVFVTWEATRTIHSELYIVSRSAGEWSEILEFSGNPFTTKANPRLSTTHERFLEFDASDDGIAERNQTILHLTWWDEQGGLGRVLWTPLVVTHDSLLPIAPIDLGSFLEEPLPISEVSPNLSLTRKPYIQAGRDQGHVILSYIEPSSGRLVTFSIRLSGGAIDSIADDARAQVIIIGSQNPTRLQLAESLRLELAANGALVTDPAVADYLSQQAAEAVLAAPPESTLESIAEDARAQVIIIGARVRGSMTNTTGDARAQVIIIGDRHPGLLHGRSLAVSLVDHRPAPEIPEDVNARLMVSPDGLSMIVAWEAAENSLAYVESLGEGWGEPRSLRLGAEITLEQALEILEHRLGS